MRRIIVFGLLCTSFAYARDRQAPQFGTLLQMDSVNCGTDKGHQKMHTLLCQEYVVQTDHVNYRIRLKDDKHPVLLPVGGNAQFRIEKDSMKLSVEGSDNNKEREYVVVSMTPRAEAQTADNRK
ncbi:MAG: hypothetical protein WAJ97_10955 [Terriglobales bacterium]|jgi:hypothetical protein